MEPKIFKWGGLVYLLTLVVVAGHVLDKSIDVCCRGDSVLLEWFIRISYLMEESVIFFATIGCR